MKILRPNSRRRIPDTAKRVFKGKLFDIYQWPQIMFDGSTATYEGLKRTDTVNIFPVTKEGKIILGKQDQPGVKTFIGGFGGRMEEGEDPIQAAKRELLEETGFKANKWELWFASQPVGKIDWVIYSFIAKDLEKINHGELEVGERIQLQEFTFDEFINLTAKEHFRDWEVSLYIYRAIKDKRKFESIRKIFLP